MVSPLEVYIARLLGVSLFVLLASYCFGGGFRRQGFSARAITLFFVLFVAAQIGGLAFGGSVRSTVVLRLIFLIPNMGIAAYVFAFLTGLALGSEPSRE